jgi:hypothetical protein
MSDRLPGSSWSNPILYRGYEIALASYSPAARFDWEAVHENYDGDEDSRIVRAASVEACKAEIDERIDEGFDDKYGSCDSGRQPKAEDPKGLSGEAMPERRPEEAASPKGTHDD